MGRSKRFLNGVVLGYGFQALAMLTGLWLTPFLLARIGRHDFGVWLIALQLLAYLSWADVGVIALLPREIAYVTGRSDAAAQFAELRRLVGRSALFALLQSGIVAAVVIFLWLVTPLGWRDYRGPIGFVLVAFTVLFPLRIFRAILEGLQDLAFCGRVQILSWGAGTAATVGLVMGRFGLYSLAGGWVITQALSAMAMAWRVRTRFPDILPTKRQDFSATGALAYLKRSGWASLTQIAQPLLCGIDIVIIGKVLGPVAVVSYTCTGKLISILANQPQLLMETAMPGLSEVKAGLSQEHIFRVTSALTQATLMVSGAVVCVVLVVNQGFVRWWVGANEFGGHKLTLLLAVAMLLRHMNLTAVYSMFSYGYEKRLSVMCLLDGLVTLGASVMLIRWLGPLGGPLGTITSVCLVTLPANLMVVARVGGVSLPILLRPLMPWFCRSVLLAFAAVLAVRYWTPSSFPEIALAAAVSAIAYVAVMLPVSRASYLWPYLQPRLAPIREFLYGVR